MKTGIVDFNGSNFLPLLTDFLSLIDVTVSTLKMAVSQVALEWEAAEEVGALWLVTMVQSHHRERPSSCRTCRNVGNHFSTAKRTCRPNPCPEIRP
jgi:hypothetical protein